MREDLPGTQIWNTGADHDMSNLPRDLCGRFLKRGKSRWKKCLHCHKKFYKKLQKESVRQWNIKIYCSSHCFGKSMGYKKGYKSVFSKKTRTKISEANKGKKWTPEMRKKLSGKNSHFWKGGITPLNERLRKTIDYASWRIAIFKRDNYTCQICSQRGVQLHADHIKPFSLFPDLRLAIENGRALCVDCHKQTDTYGRRVVKFL